MKKRICILLAALLLTGTVGCRKTSPTEGAATTGTAHTQTTNTTHTTAPTTNGTELPPPPPRYEVNDQTGQVIAGELETILASGGSIAVSYDQPYAGQPNLDYASSAVFTLREYLLGGQNLQFSPLTWQDTQDAYVLEYTTMGLYSFALNRDLSGWTILCEMAAAPPEDVTAAYVGRYGIAEGESAKAWRIPLNSQAFFSNGTQITAQTYAYSYQQLLDARLENSRAEEICRGDFAIAGAAEYYAGTGAWEDVGILVTGEMELVLITAKSVAQPEFYVPYYLQSSYLVYPALWEKCLQYWDAEGNLLSGDSEAAVKITSTYGTSAKTYLSYGPYVLLATDQTQLTLERNFTWYGYADGKHLGQYQTDRIECLLLQDQAQAQQAYAEGRIDRLYLTEDMVADFWESGLLRYQQESYTTKLTFNTHAESLAQRGNLVLTNAAFRSALALALERDTQALINEMYFADVSSGLIYRENATAAEILSHLAGYDVELARQMMQRAYTQCLADGSYDGQSQITLQLSVYRQEESYVRWHSALEMALENACEGTGFAGKITIELVVDPLCYTAMAAGQTDMILTTWGGNPCDPYDLFYTCYCTAQRMEYGFDPAAVTVQICIDGEDYVATLLDWAAWCVEEGPAPVSENGTELALFSAYDAQTRADLLAQLEYAYLSQYVTIPLYSRGSWMLLSEKGTYAVPNARTLVGFGGVRYYTFAYSDVQWDAYCAEKENTEG